jgi:hypothetical protein
VEMLSERYEQAITNLLAYLDGESSSLINPDVQIRHAT